MTGSDTRCKVCANAYEAKRREDPAVRKRKREQQQSVTSREKAGAASGAATNTRRQKEAPRSRQRAKSYSPRQAEESDPLRSVHFVFSPGSDTPKNQDLFGCTRTQFRAHIESLWKPWMNWDNYGTNTGQYKKTWQFDHIVPYTAFPTYEDLDEHKHAVCWYKNVQPLCAKKNKEKNDAFTPEERDVLIAWHRQCSSI